MAEKLRDYFTAGARLVWYVDPELRQVEVFTSPTDRQVVGEDQILSGGEVLPGFELNLRELFAELPPE
jgi:Uma2 family endonuclease